MEEVPHDRIPVPVAHRVPVSPGHPFAVAGICWDGSVTNRPGARFGPRAIRTASNMLCDATHPRAHDGRPLAVVHFDAHCDAWRDHLGEPGGHGTWVVEAIREGLVVRECMTQFGIRSAGDRAAREYERDQGGLIFTARDLRGLASPAQRAPFVDQVRARWKANGQPPLYLSFDIDALDPAYAPGTGTAQAFTLLEELSALPFMGMDCVEVAPVYDHRELTSLAAAQLVWTWLAGRVKVTCG